MQLLLVATVRGGVSSLVRPIGSLYSTDREPAPQKDLSWNRRRDRGVTHLSIGKLTHT